MMSWLTERPRTRWRTFLRYARECSWRRGLIAIKKHAASQKIIDCNMRAQVVANDGDLVTAQLLRYVDERREFYDRWVARSPVP